MDTNPLEINGFFNIFDQEIFGTLKLDGEDTLITLRSKHPTLSPIEINSLTGIGFDHKIISCLECLTIGFQQNYHQGGIESSLSIFPHYVSIGNTTLNITENTITEVTFTTNDLATLFNDRSAFGHLFSTDSQLKTLLEINHEEIRNNSTLNFELTLPKIAETPHIFYWTGKLEIFRSKTEIGELTVNHNPSFSVDGKTGIICENNITATLKFDKPIDFETAIDNTSTFTRFLSAITGRTQSKRNIKIKKIESSPDSYLDVHCSYSPSASAIPLQSTNDIPLNPILRTDEFSTVLQNWIAREPEWRIGRIQFLNSLHKTGSYDSDRLVSAANVFDILPSASTIPNKEIPENYQAARDECIKILEALPISEDRGAAIGAMKRWGRANLRSKVLHRAQIVKSHIPQITNEIDRLLILAIKTRNYFVHGTDDFNYQKYESFLPLFTDALEFIFSASDLIECGWNPKSWLNTRPAYAHNYANFINTYHKEINSLKLIDGEAKHWTK